MKCMRCKHEIPRNTKKNPHHQVEYTHAILEPNPKRVRLSRKVVICENCYREAPASFPRRIDLALMGIKLQGEVK